MFVFFSVFRFETLIFGPHKVSRSKDPEKDDVEEQGPRFKTCTGVADGRVQQVHGGSAQAQSVHPVRGLFQVRHHARGSEGGPGVGGGCPGVPALGSYRQKIRLPEQNEPTHKIKNHI